MSRTNAGVSEFRQGGGLLGDDEHTIHVLVPGATEVVAEKDEAAHFIGLYMDDGGRSGR